MKAVILAGGLGSRLSEETTTRPKPMVEVGGRPILWHIMKSYAAHGVCDFIVCLGYKGWMIKEYFANYYMHSCDLTVDLVNNRIEYHNNASEPWRVTLIDTGDASMTGGRLRRVLPLVQDDECFCMTYGDGVADIDITRLIAYHRAHGKQATVTAVQPSGKFGSLNLSEDDSVQSFIEKPAGDNRWVGGGYFVLSPKVGELLVDDATVWEREPMESLSREGQMMAYRHHGFWQSMDTIYDRTLLDNLWRSGKAPCKTW